MGSWLKVLCVVLGLVGQCVPLSLVPNTWEETSTLISAPGFRIHHSCASVVSGANTTASAIAPSSSLMRPGLSVVIVFGGQVAQMQPQRAEVDYARSDEMWLFYPEGRFWLNVSHGLDPFVKSTSWPPARQRHSALMMTLPNEPIRMILFGGCEDSVVWSFDLTSTQWSPVIPQNPAAPVPQPRFSHGAAIVGSYMVIFGGCAWEEKAGGCDSPLADVWVWSHADRTWTQAASSGSTPSPRFGHTLWSLGSRILVFGGFKNLANLQSGVNAENAVYDFSLDNFPASSSIVWSIANPGYAASASTPDDEPDPRGPSPLGFATISALVDTTSAVLVGGRSDMGSAPNTHVWKFHGNTNLWEYMPSPGVVTDMPGR